MKTTGYDILGCGVFVLMAVVAGVIVAPFMPIIFAWFAWKDYRK